MKLFLSAKGRIGPKLYWIGAIIILAITALPFAPIGALSGLTGLLGLIFFYPGICFYSKRLHDLGLSGWLQVLFYLAIVGVGFYGVMQFMPTVIDFAMTHQNDQAAVQAFAREKAANADLGNLSYVVLAIKLVWVIGLGLLPGQKGSNKHG